MSSAKEIARLERDKQVIELRRAGHTCAEIGRMVVPPGQKPMTHSAVVKIIMKHLAEITQEPSEALRKQELDRLDALQESLWMMATKGLRPARTINGKVALDEKEQPVLIQVKVEEQRGVVDQIMRIMGHRAKLMGLERAPVQKVEVTGKDGAPLATPLEQLEEIRKRIALNSDGDQGAEPGNGEPGRAA